MSSLNAESEGQRPLLTIIMVNWRVPDLMIEAVKSAEAKGGLSSAEIQWLLVDNASGDNSVRKLREAFPDKDLTVVESNIGFGQANNLVYPKAKGKYILLLNPDTLTLGGTLREMVGFMDRNPDTGILGCRLLNEDGSFQRAAGGAFPTLANLSWNYLFLNKFIPRSRSPSPLFMEDDPEGDFRIDWVSGAALMIRPEAAESALFDPQFWMYGEDIGLCRRVTASGWRVMYTSRGSIIHYGGKSMTLQDDADLLDAPIKGLRQYFLLTNHCPSIAYDGILLVGYTLRWILYGLLSVFRSRDRNRLLSRISRQYAGKCLKLLFCRN